MASTVSGSYGVFRYRSFSGTLEVTSFLLLAFRVGSSADSDSHLDVNAKRLSPECIRYSPARSPERRCRCKQCQINHPSLSSWPLLGTSSYSQFRCSFIFAGYGPPLASMDCIRRKSPSHKTRPSSHGEHQNQGKDVLMANNTEFQPSWKSVAVFHDSSEAAIQRLCQFPILSRESLLMH
jgi:hypothetical protein